MKSSVQLLLEARCEACDKPAEVATRRNAGEDYRFFCYRHEPHEDAEQSGEATNE